MGNNWFHFKQFTVLQDNTSFRVTTEACLFGALIETENHHNILDIGTGTGLLTLMLAQKTPDAQLYGVEIDPNSANLASINFENSPWKERLVVVNQDIATYSQEHLEQYDLVISNPPFYANSLKSNKEDRNRAMHNASLSHEQLSNSIDQLLTENGKAWVLLPPQEAINFKGWLNSKNLFVLQTLKIFNFKDKPIFREIVVLSKKQPLEVLIKEIIIYKNQKEYSEEFIQLLRPYYASLA